MHTDSISLCIDEPGRTSQLTEVLGAAYDLRREEPCEMSAQEGAETDVLVLDLSAFRRVGAEEVQAYKALEPGVASPVLLLAPQSRLSQLDPAVWDEVDEVIGTPVARPELEGRVEALLRMRRYSREADRALKEREARLQGLAHSIPGVVFQFYARPDGTYGTHFVSEHAATLLGISPEAETFFERFRERIPASHRQAFEESVTEAIEDAAPWRFETPFRKSSGERLWLMGRSTPKQQDGELVYNGVLLDITDRKEAEEKLTEERDRLATLFHNLPTPVVHCWADAEDRMRIQAVNSAFESTFGVEEERVENEDLQSLIVPEDRQEEAGEIRQDLLSGESIDRDVQRRAADGPRDFRVQVALREGDNGPTEGFAIYTDITAEKQSQRELEAYREYTDRLLDGIEDIFFVHDENGDLQRWNESVREVTGYTDAELASMNGVDLIAEERRAKTVEKIERVFEEGFARLEAPLLAKDGSTIPYEYAANRVEDPDGTPRLVGIGRDISERKQKERELAHRRALLEAQADTTIDGLLAVDTDRNVAFYNDQFLNIWDIPPDIIERGPVGEPLDPLLLNAVSDLLENTEEFREQVEYLYDHPAEESRDLVQLTDGRWLDRYSAPIIGEDGTHFGRLWVFRDVTEREKREQELLEAKEKAEEASHLKSAMLANMSHEVRTPLTSITGFLEILKNGLTGQQAEFANRAYGSARRLMKTLDSVLELSKLEAGIFELDREPVRLKPLVTETVELLRPQARKKDHAVNTVLPDDDVEGRWNAEALNRIFENLIENAIKFTPQGGTITVRVRARAEAAVIEVEDTGVGIAEEACSEIFEAFKQESQGYDREYEGSGLGLSIVQKLIRALEGTITVESEKGVGTCFTVVLPYTSGSDS